MLLRIACSLIRIRLHKVFNQRQLPSLKWNAESRMLLGLHMTFKLHLAVFNPISIIQNDAGAQAVSGSMCTLDAEH